MNGLHAVLSIEGQIGAGKTTLGTFLSEELGIPLYRELANPQTGILLSRFYAEMDRWAFTTQVHFLVLRARQCADIESAGAGILDRSIYGDRIFADVLYEDGHMSDEEYQTYSDLYRQVLARVAPPDLMIYLECDTPTALRRIHRRNRASEAHIDPSYLERLHEHYLAWFRSYSASPKMFVSAAGDDLIDPTRRQELAAEVLAALEISSGAV